MSDSLQHKLDRVRQPRVQITYDVETGGALQQKELPFVVGVLADLSGKPEKALKPIKDRSFTNIDRDNFNEVLEKAAPRLAYRVEDRLTGEEGQQVNVELKFKNIEDFEPAQVARQIPALKELLDMRQRLNELLGKMEGNEKLEALLGEVLGNTETAKTAASELGLEETK
jgi:type VI secretion system protein ImpB